LSGRLRKQGNFTIVSNAIVLDPKLSAKAKGLYLYISSRPDGWNFRIAEICSNMSDGADSVRSGLRELEVNEYLKRHRTHTEQGTFLYDYEIFETVDGKCPYPENPHTVEPHRENPHTVEPHTGLSATGKRGGYIKTELSIKTELKNIEESNSENGSLSQEISPEHCWEKIQDSVDVFLDEWTNQFGTIPIFTETMKTDGLGRLKGLNGTLIRNTVKKYADALKRGDCWISVRDDAFSFLNNSKKGGFVWCLNAEPEQFKKWDTQKEKPKESKNFFDQFDFSKRGPDGSV